MDSGFSLLTAHDLLSKDVDELKALVRQRRGAEAGRLEKERGKPGRPAEPARPAKPAVKAAPAEEKTLEGECPRSAAGVGRNPNLCVPSAVPAVAMETDDAGPHFAPEDVALLSGHTNEVYSCAFSPAPGSALLASSGSDATARLWTLGAPGPPGCVVLRHSGEGAAEGGGGEGKDVQSLEWRGDGALLATGSYDGVVRVWRPDGGLASVLEGHTGPVFSVRWSRTGALLLSCSGDATACVWDGATGAVRQRFQLHQGAVMDVDWQDEGTFASCGADRAIHVCRLGEEAPLRSYAAHSSEVNAVRWDPAGLLLASCSDDGSAKLWALGQAEAVRTLSGHTKEIYTLKWAPTGPGSANPGRPPLLATASFDASVRLWAAAEGTCLALLAGHTEPVYSVAFSPDGGLLASGSFDGTVRVWAVAAAAGAPPLRSFRGAGGVYEVCWSREGDRLAASFASKLVVALSWRAA